MPSCRFVNAFAGAPDEHLAQGKGQAAQSPDVA
jgi:hypothetical protein